MTISVPEDVARTIRAAASGDDLTVSAWLTEAARRYADDNEAIRDGLAATREWEAEHGAFTDEEMDEARRELVAYGILPPDPDDA
jgi:hypothetical protein